MGLLNFLKPKPASYFTPAERENIVQAIRFSEQRTCGEVRVFIESKCRFMDPIDRACEVFYGLKMEKTEKRNGVLVYIALKDKQLALFADEGIHKATGAGFWKKEAQEMLKDFSNGGIPQGIVKVINDIGEALHIHFPYDNTTDRNELPDDIVFGS